MPSESPSNGTVWVKAEEIKNNQFMSCLYTTNLKNNMTAMILQPLFTVI